MNVNTKRIYLFFSLKKKKERELLFLNFPLNFLKIINLSSKESFGNSRVLGRIIKVIGIE